MYTGKPTTRPEQPTITGGESVETDASETDGGNHTNDTSTLSQLVSAARTASEVVAPFAAIASSIVHAITAYKFISKV